MKDEPRRSIRLKAYDYTQAGTYYVTMCTRDRVCWFGDIVDDAMALNAYGVMVRDEWLETECLRDHVELDEFVVMPNHIHAILSLGPMAEREVPAERVGTARRAPTERFGRPIAGSLPTIVRAFKSAVTKRINALRGTPGTTIWQRNYYEHVIRDENELNRIRAYIVDNPAKWAIDRENPAVFAPVGARRVVPSERRTDAEPI